MEIMWCEAIPIDRIDRNKYVCTTVQTCTYIEHTTAESKMQRIHIHVRFYGTACSGDDADAEEGGAREGP